MHLQAYLFFGQCLIFFNQLYFTTAKAMVGAHVRQARPNENYPTVAILRIDNSNLAQLELNQFCGGVLISNSHVLSSSTCMENVRLNETQIIVGSTDIRCGLVLHPVWWVNYNRWASRRRLEIKRRVNDICIIKVHGVVPDGFAIGVIATVRNSDLFGLQVEVTGWGMSANNQHNRHLQKVNLQIISNEDCEERIENVSGYAMPIHRRLLCSVANPFALMYNVFNSFALFYFLAKPIIGDNVRRARPEEFPSVVSLMAINHYAFDEFEEDHFCTGALMTNSHVLTAAHCLEGILKNQTQIVIGSIDLRCGMIYFPLWWVDYNGWASVRQVHLEFRVNDIAIIKLTVNVPDSITPLAISNVNNEHLYGLNVMTAGWGIANNGRTPRFMETVALRILSNYHCEQRIANCHGSKVPIHHRLLCTVGEPFAVMQLGDSGAPIIFSGIILGVQKSTAPFAELAFHPEKVNIHTGVIYYRDFIMDILSSNYMWF